MRKREDAIGNCTDLEVIEHLFGTLEEFVRVVDEHGNGNDFETESLIVEYDEVTDIHWFYLK